MKTLKLISNAIGFFLLLLMAAAGDSEPGQVFAVLPFAVLFFWAGDAFKGGVKDDTILTAPNSRDTQTTQRSR